MKLREAAGWYRKIRQLFGCVKATQTANIIYCEYFISSLWKDKPIWTKLCGFQLRRWHTAGAQQRLNCPAKALWWLTVLSTLQDRTTAGRKNIWKCSDFKIIKYVFLNANRVQMLWRTRSLCYCQDSQQQQAVKPGFPEMLLSAYKTPGRFQHWRKQPQAEQVQARQDFLHAGREERKLCSNSCWFQREILRDFCQLAHSVLSLSIMEPGTEIYIKYRPAAQKYMQIPTL